MYDYFTINNLICFIEQFSPSFQTKIEGASAEEIEEYRSLVPIPIPQIVIDYLLRFGHQAGGFNPFTEPRAEIRYLIDLYKEDYQKELFFPPDCIVVACGGLSIPEICVQIIDDADKPVVTVDSGKITTKWADSFDKFIFQGADLGYKQFHFPYRHQLWNHSCVQQIAQIIGRLERYGFVRCPYSDSITYCGELVSAAVSCQQNKEAPPDVRISCDDKQLADAVVQDLATTFQMRARQW